MSCTRRWMPCDETLYVYFLGRGKVIKGGVVADRSRATVACAHPVPIDLKPDTDLRVRILRSLTVAGIHRRVLEDTIGPAVGATARVGSKAVDTLVMRPTFSTERTVLDDRAPGKRYPMNLDESRGRRTVQIGVRAGRVEIRLKVTG